MKRRHSEAAEAEQESKRQRISPGKNSPTTARDDAHDGSPKGATTQEQPNVEPRGARRKSSVADEKQRSKRLFGALLGSLNQPGDRTSKRRQEIESRRKAELQRQDDERVEDKLRRQEKLAGRRRREQERVDEQNVYDQHPLWYESGLMYVLRCACDTATCSTWRISCKRLLSRDWYDV